MKKEKFTKKQLVEKFGNEKQKAYFEKYGFLAKTTEQAILKTLIQKYGFVQKTKEGNCIYYIVGAKRDKEIMRDSQRKPYDESFYVEGVVYCVTNKINGKKYVGSTSQTLAQRMTKHKNSSFDAESLNYNTKIAEAFREYGWGNFKWEVLEIVDDADELRQIECYWIYYLEAFEDDKGYNYELGKWVKIG
ncbi:GIY-YIG nuclease family protein [Bacillus sp. FJAT-50079]|uniref:GIY-YIG nuclease family protein n=1 Tax=Bacillus sp. FJAT-50079 TaxID=2833577 RepID=UPI001BC900D6|nr:GIY-YIG nuclease family protein [Bacillus sp. FJAT-50079]MBS4207467.1 GIY-YIG nuclease family protein [Bacillus sp. FJAT-50079]